MTAGFLRVQHNDTLHRLWLAEVYRWASARPEAYLADSGYASRTDFYEPPHAATEFFITLRNRPIALLTFLPTAANEYRIGLITAPNTPVRRMLTVMRAALDPLRESGVTRLWVRLPEAACYDSARKLAARLGFARLNETDWNLRLINGNAKQ